MVSDIRGAGRGKDDGLELSWSRFEKWLQFVFNAILYEFSFTLQIFIESRAFI